jgi:hypothetical protein
MRRSIRKSRSMLVIGLPALLLACGGSKPPAGNYTASSFVTTAGLEQTDQLKAGSTLVLNLNADRSTSGHLQVPTSGVDADMAGEWTQNDTTVTITQAADTFVRDMPFTLTHDPEGGWILVGDKTFSGTRIRVTLKRG